MKLLDEFDHGIGWSDDGTIPRTSHALFTDEGTWLVDPVDPGGAVSEERLGSVRGVIQLLDRHERDCAALAGRFGVQHVRAFTLPGGPFEYAPVRHGRWWKEVALWWPQHRVLVCADALGTLPYFVAPGERVGVHPLLRLAPPNALRTYRPDRILVGHGRGVHDGAAGALQDALATPRRRLPRALLHGVRASRRRRDVGN